MAYGKDTSVAEGCNLIVPHGAKLTLGDEVYIGRYVELGPAGDVSIGDRTSIQDRSIIVGNVRLGNYCVLSLNVLIASGHHYYDLWPHLTIREQDQQALLDPTRATTHNRPVVIEDDCWLGVNSVILRGVKIAKGCIVGSNSVVTRDLAPYSVAAGVPARVIRRRLEFLPPPRITSEVLECLPYFYSGFACMADQRQANASIGGLLAKGPFSVWLGGALDQKIHLKLRSLTNSWLTNVSGGEKVAVSTEWIVANFSRKDVNEPHAFNVEGAPIAVSDAWIA